MMSAAVSDPKAAALFEDVGTRRVTPPRALAPMALRIAAVNARRLASSARRARS
jgi:hypothetical protein